MVSFSFINAPDATTIVFIVLLVVLIVALLVVPMFTNKKRAKQTEELHRSLQPGDLIKTVGGIIGTIKEIRQVSPVDREMVIETGDGDNKTTMVFDIQALYQVMSRSNTVVPASGDNVDDAAEDMPETEAAAPVVAPVEEPKAEEVKEPVATEEPVNEAPVEKEEAVEAPVTEQAATEAAPEKTEAGEEAKPQAATVAKKKPVGGAKKSTNAPKSTKK